MTDPSRFTDELTFHLKERYGKPATKSFELLDFAFAFGNPLDALMYAKVFWPDFVEFSGMIFHQEVLSTDADRQRVLQMSAENSSHQDIEKSFNQFDVPSSFFGKHVRDTSDREDIFLGELISEMWQARLSFLFPDRKINVQYLAVDGDEASITIFQEA
jgi:hypothetical protein